MKQDTIQLSGQISETSTLILKDNKKCSKRESRALKGQNYSNNYIPHNDTRNERVRAKNRDHISKRH